MCKPEFIIKKTDLTPNGALKTESVQKIKSILEDRGAVLLPSDTCYSFAVIPKDKDMIEVVQHILDRDHIPISIAFPGFEKVKQYIEINQKSNKLFEKFTPGCITIVCKAKQSSFADITLTQDGTIGARITDCLIERTVAGCTDYPITTTPPLISGEGIKDFDLALKIIHEGIKKSGTPLRWAAIEADKFYSTRSTVVKVNEDGSLKRLRQGEIPFEEIKSALEN